MSMYVKVLDSGSVIFPYPLASLRLKHPSVSFPTVIDEETLAQYSVYPVIAVQAPSYEPLTHSATSTVEKVNGQWTQVWKVTELEREAAEANIRMSRNQLLQSCDWTQLADSAVDKATWAAYRQELRDISLQSGFPWSVAWPQSPA
jgi:hypothetical protein